MVRIMRFKLPNNYLHGQKRYAPQPSLASPDRRRGLLASSALAGGALQALDTGKLAHEARVVGTDDRDHRCASLDQRMGHEALEIFRGLTLHAGRDFLGEEFEQKIRHGFSRAGRSGSPGARP